MDVTPSRAFGRRTAALAAPAVTMSVVHEMHQRAGQEQNIGQYPEDMSGVLGNQKKACDRQEAAHCKAKWRSPPWNFNLLVHFDRPLRVCFCFPAIRAAADYIMPIGPTINRSAIFF
jgi:hypothetical protein